MRKLATLDHNSLLGARHGRGMECERPTVLDRIERALHRILEWTLPPVHGARRRHSRVRAMALPWALVAACAGGQALAQTNGQLAGSRLIEEGFTCAGWKFGVDGTAARYDEVLCRRGDWPSLTAKVRWLSADQLILVESNEAGPTPDRPPRVWLVKMESVSAKKVQLRETWIGWGAGGDALATFRRTR